MKAKIIRLLVQFNDIYQIFMSFCMLCMVAFCQSVLLKRDDDDDDDDEL